MLNGHGIPLFDVEYLGNVLVYWIPPHLAVDLDVSAVRIIDFDFRSTNSIKYREKLIHGSNWNRRIASTE